MRLISTLTRRKAEDRSLAPPQTRPGLPWGTTAPLDVTQDNALRVADAYACIRVLADSVASLPPKVFRHTDQGRVPAGPDARLVQLLQSPSPGATSADLFSQVMVHLNTNGSAFIGKFRSEGSIVSLGLLDPQQVEVELRGQRIVYVVTTAGRRSRAWPPGRCARQGRERGRAARHEPGHSVEDRPRPVVELAGVSEGVHRKWVASLGDSLDAGTVQP